MTTRSHETIRVGLRRIIRDPNATVNERLQATKLLMRVEGLMEAGKTKVRKCVTTVPKETNSQELLDLLKSVESEGRGSVAG
jgi:hypothetical protein